MAIHMHVKIHIDTNRYEKSDVKDAVEAGLATEFSLINRNLGQPIYVAEILAAMERIEGVSSAIIIRFFKKNRGADTVARSARWPKSWWRCSPLKSRWLILKRYC